MTTDWSQAVLRLFLGQIGEPLSQSLAKELTDIGREFQRLRHPFLGRHLVRGIQFVECARCSALCCTTRLIHHPSAHRTRDSNFDSLRSRSSPFSPPRGPHPGHFSRFLLSAPPEAPPRLPSTPSCPPSQTRNGDPYPSSKKANSDPQIRERALAPLPPRPSFPQRRLIETGSGLEPHHK